MKVEELAYLMGKTKTEFEKILKEKDVIELNLTEKNRPRAEKGFKIEIIE